MSNGKDTNGRPYKDCNSLVNANVARHMKPIERRLDKRMERIEYKQDEIIDLIQKTRFTAHNFIQYALIIALGLIMLFTKGC
jgi:tetrahydromethanopterin S-methyltransferase subunit G